MMKLNLEKMGSFLQLHLELKISHLWLVGWLGTMDRVVFPCSDCSMDLYLQHRTSN